MVFTTSLFLLYLVEKQPFISQVDFSLNIFSTALLVLLYVMCFLFSIQSTELFLSRRLSFGYFFISLVLLLFLVNVVIIVIFKLTLCFLFCKKRTKQKLFPFKRSLHLSEAKGRKLET